MNKNFNNTAASHNGLPDSTASSLIAQPVPLTVYKASAGSGKTFTLATEYIKLLVKEPQNYSRILAVTFTNKATEEMKIRILSQLYGIWQGLEDSRSYMNKVREGIGGHLSDEQIAQRAGQALYLLLHNYTYFRVETIDSFFQSVMRNLARELNLTANLRVGLNDAQVEEMAVDKMIDSLSTKDQELQWILRYITDNISDDRSWNVIAGVKNFGLTIFKDYYKSHSKELKQVMEQDGFFDRYQNLLRKIRQQARNRMTDIATQFFDTLESERLTIDDLSYGRNGLASLFLKLQKGEMDESIISKRASDSLGQPDRWCTKTHPRRELIMHLADTSLGALLRQSIEEQPRQWKLYKSADLTLRHLPQLRLLGSIERKVRELNDEQNRFLLSDTQQLLHELIDGSDTPFIFEKIGTQLEHIMIDEFQDTSTVQWQNFKVLLEETMSHKGSENLIVGDVKQSIYRWRSGDWRLLEGIGNQFNDSSQTLAIKTLSTNYRSARRIIDFNNAFFTQAAKAEGVVAYDDVKQEVPQSKDDEGEVVVTLLPPKDYEQQTLEALALKVEELLQAGTPESDIAILVRVNSHIPLIARYFMQRLPQLKVVSDEAFRLDASAAVTTIVSALRYLARPDDAIALACIKKDCTKHGLNELPEGLSARLLQLPLYEMVEQIYALLQPDANGTESAYLCAFFDKVSMFAADYGSDIDTFIREWDENIGATTIQSDGTSGLRLVSIHKSKGLEFPYVLIPFCDWRLELPDVLWCTPTEKPFSQLPLAPIDFSQKGMKGTIYESDYEEEHQQNMVDNLNLLYVAFTRASSALYVWGKRKCTSSSRSALIAQVLPAIMPCLDGAQLEGEGDEESSLVFSYKTVGMPGRDIKKEQQDNKKSDNPFLQPSHPQKVSIGILPAKADFRQSNNSRRFATSYPEEEQEHQQYIQLGSVLHNVLASIRNLNDVESALMQMEQEGVLYGEGSLSRSELTNMLRKRLASPKVEEWFKPGRWQLFNECTILSIDKATGRLMERRPDRVMTDGQKTIVVDFKFGNDHEEYHEQVRQYMNLLRQMGHANVEGYLWLVYSNRIIEVSEIDTEKA